MFISPFALTFQRSFCEKPLLKTALRNLLRVVYTVKQSCGDVTNKNCLK